MNLATRAAADQPSARGDRTEPGSGATDRTISDLPLKPVYTTADADAARSRETSLPGEYPYTRGIHPNMYRDRLWTMRQFAGFGNARQTNERYKFLLGQGQTGLSVAFDMPTLMGYDSDAPQALGEVGQMRCRNRLAARHGDPLRRDRYGCDYDLDDHQRAGRDCFGTVHRGSREAKGIPRAKLGGTLQADILKEYIAQKEWIFPPRPHVRIIVDMMKFCTSEMPRWNTISISGYHIREAGSSAAQELAFTLADGFAYVEAAMAAGMDIDSFAPRLSFFFNSHSDFFEEICKFRAARRIYARHMREKYGAKDPRSWMLRFHTQTAGCSATAQQPENNIVRVAYEAMAAVLGGTQSLHTNSMDEVLALPTEKSVEIALRTQQVLAYETNVTNVADPLGGSYYVEALTDELERQAENYFERIAEFGGVIPAIEAGFFQSEIADASYRYQRSLESKDRVIVGVNAFQKPDEQQDIDLLKIGRDVELAQARELADVRRSRDAQAVKRALTGLEHACATDTNVMPPLIEAVRALATEGEIVETMARVFGRYVETAVI